MVVSQISLCYINNILSYRHTTCVSNTGKLHTQNVPNPTRSSVSEPANEIYTALWPFQARANEELTFQEGEHFRICDRQGDLWTAVKLDRNGMVTAKGFVPQKYLARRETVKEQPSYFGTLNRFETQNLLLAPGNGVGAFLLRHSEKDHIRCVLSGRSDLSLFCLMPTARHKTTGSFPPNRFKEEFTLEEELGKGYFADVYRGKWKGMVNVAIKSLKNNESLNHRELLMETQILKKLRHRHLIALFAVCTSSTPYYIITELMEKGNLLSFLRGEDGQNLEPQELIEMSSQVADGMAYLEEQNSNLRDLAARNVLVGHNYICKVADFGLARIVKEPIYSSEDKKIPYKWCAPEAISHGRFSNKSDVWSFGVLLYEMFTYGGFPYPGIMPSPPKCPSHIYDTKLICWRDSADERLDFNELKMLLENSGTGYVDAVGSRVEVN
uniref:non-specific protein-tyrosine kinase n=1 Tax=Sinocyclocheilus anshuiensis TaxID=1608454 RepID=A0A671MU43_9TELE